jgi:hypothetical protein
MKNFLVTESERIQILKKHRSLLKEAPQPTDERAVLDAGHKAGCFGAYPVANGQIGTLKSGQIVFQKPSKNKPGQFVRYLANQTYYFYDPKTKQSSQAFKLVGGCKAMTDYGKPSEEDLRTDADIQYYKKLTPPYKTEAELRAANEYTPEIRNSALYDYIKVGNVELFRKKSQQTGGMNDQKNEIKTQWITYLKDQGFEVNPTDTEKEGLISGRLYDTVKNIPQGVFPPDQLVWFDPSKNLDSDKLGDKQENEDIDRGSCKNTIERFYNEFIRTKGRQVTQTAVLQKMKDQAQFCKNRWEGKWGIGGGKFEDMIKVLSGRKSGGPSSSGSDAIFRLQ